MFMCDRDLVFNIINQKRKTNVIQLLTVNWKSGADL